MHIVFKANIQNYNFLLYWSRQTCQVIRVAGDVLFLKITKTLKNCWWFKVSLNTYHYVVALEYI